MTIITYLILLKLNKKKKKKLQFSLSFPGVGTFSDMCACILFIFLYLCKGIHTCISSVHSLTVFKIKIPKESNETGADQL